jgi:site-specific recombinase
MTPALGRFLGLPLDVRHVTLSAGFLAASASTLGLEALRTREVWWAVAGLSSMGLLNVGVSFGLALSTAARAQGVKTPERAVLLGSFWRRIRRHPADLVRPQRPVGEESAGRA